MSIPTLTLSNGNQVPLIGLGTGARTASGDREKMYQAIRDAIKIGYRHIDTATFYGVEAEVGRAVNDAINDGDVTREQLFVTTKLWMDRMKREQVIPTLKQSLELLRVDYVDLYLIHWPMSIDGDNAFGPDAVYNHEHDVNRETWPEFEKAFDLGLAKNIGVSNFNSKQIDELMKVTVIASRLSLTA